MDLLLDSNIWRYLVDSKATGRLVRATKKKSKIKIVVSPAVLYEALRTKDEGLRNALVAAMTLPSWKRLLPEAYWEATEIKSEICRTHKSWALCNPDISWHQRVLFDWTRSTNGFWDRARLDPRKESERIGGEEILEAARVETKTSGDEAKNLPKKWQSIKYADLKVIPLDGDIQKTPTDHWRIGALNSFTSALNSPYHPYHDWLSGQLNLELMKASHSSVVDFFLRETKAENMPRHWLRGFAEYQQLFLKVTNGTPVDNQLASYLFGVDLFLSADKNMVRIANHCRMEAPFQTAQAMLLPAGDQTIEELLKLF